MKLITHAPVELYVRSLSPSGIREQQEQVLKQLDELREKGVISDYDVYVIGDELPHGSRAVQTRFGQFVYHRLITVQHWAERNRATCKPAIKEHAVTQLDSPKTYDVTVPPKLMLVEFHEDSIVFAAPVCFGDRNYCVDDHLAAMDPESDFRIPERDVVGELLDPVRRVWRMAEESDEETIRKRQVSPI